MLPTAQGKGVPSYHAVHAHLRFLFFWLTCFPKVTASKRKISAPVILKPIITGLAFSFITHLTSSRNTISASLVTWNYFNIPTHIYLVRFLLIFKNGLHEQIQISLLKEILSFNAHFFNVVHFSDKRTSYLGLLSNSFYTIISLFRRFQAKITPALCNTPLLLRRRLEIVSS